MRHLQTNHSMVMLSKTIPGKCQPGESFFNFTSKLKKLISWRYRPFRHLNLTRLTILIKLAPIKINAKLCRFEEIAFKFSWLIDFKPI